MVDGEGCRTVLWICGCSHGCPGCQNEQMQKASFGTPMTTGDLESLCKSINRPMIDGLTLSGGDPMYLQNRGELRLVCQFVKSQCPDKSIWMYTGYRFEDIKHDPILEYIDVVVDGKYMQDRPPALYRGSDNQKIWRKIDGVWRA